MSGNPIEDARDFVARIVNEGPGGGDAYIDWIWGRRVAFQNERIRAMRLRYNLSPENHEPRSWPIVRITEVAEQVPVVNVAPFGRLAAK
jgi:hypothetical protein